MIWLTWRQFRAQAFTAIAALLLAMGFIGVAHMTVNALAGAPLERRLPGARTAVWISGLATLCGVGLAAVASIAYGSTPPVTGKERIEVLAGSRQVIIDDFWSVLVNGRTLWKGRQDKGHCAHAAAFRQAMQGGAHMPSEAMLGSMRATIQAADRARAS